MSEIDVISQIAQQALTVPTSTSIADSWLWDRARRLLRNVECICRLPELAEANVPIDRLALIGATYFSDAGFTCYDNAQSSRSKVVLAEVNLADLQVFSTRIVTDKLTGSIAASKIDKINRIIIASPNKSTDMTEAKILSDARNLDDMGAVGIFNEFRRHTMHGKSVSEALESWKRKIDYRYWQARLKENFRFESVRALAERRFSATEHFMNQLAVENSAHDLEELIMETIE